MPAKLRVGVLGAARYTPISLINPIRLNADLAERLEVTAVAARDGKKAAAYAAEFSIPKSYGSYESLIADPDIDVVYNILPNNLHCYWSIRALRAGKHVLCEKPMASNAQEALAMQRAAEDSGRVLVEAFHPICHPVAKRARRLITEGAIGQLLSVSCKFNVNFEGYDAAVRTKTHAPTSVRNDIRFQSALAGGAAMDIGCYCVNAIRFLTDSELTVVKASAERYEHDPDIDVGMEAELVTPGGVKASFESFFLGRHDPSAKNPIVLKVTGSEGVMDVVGWFHPHNGNSITITRRDGSKTEERVGPATPHTHDTYYASAMAFVEEVQRQERSGADIGQPWSFSVVKSTPADAVRSMATIDACYRAAGMRPRWTTVPPPPPHTPIPQPRL